MRCVARAAPPRGASVSLWAGCRGQGLSVREPSTSSPTPSANPPLRSSPNVAPATPRRSSTDARTIEHTLNGKAQYDVHDMVTSAWDGWRLRHPEARLPR